MDSYCFSFKRFLRYLHVKEFVFLQTVKLHRRNGDALLDTV